MATKSDKKLNRKRLALAVSAIVICVVFVSFYFLIPYYYWVEETKKPKPRIPTPTITTSGLEGNISLPITGVVWTQAGSSRYRVEKASIIIYPYQSESGIFRTETVTTDRYGVFKSKLECNVNDELGLRIEKLGYKSAIIHVIELRECDVFVDDSTYAIQWFFEIPREDTYLPMKFNMYASMLMKTSIPKQTIILPPHSILNITMTATLNPVDPQQDERIPRDEFEQAYWVEGFGNPWGSIFVSCNATARVLILKQNEILAEIYTRGTIGTDERLSYYSGPLQLGNAEDYAISVTLEGSVSMYVYYTLERQPSDMLLT